MDIDVSVVFRIGGRTFECFHGHVQAEQADGLDDVRRKIVQCVERDLFPRPVPSPLSVATPALAAPRTRAQRYVLAFSLVGVITALLAAMQVSEPRNIPSLLYMVAILAVAVRLGRGPSLLASGAAFVENVVLENAPQLASRVYEFAPVPEDWVRLTIFVVAALAASVSGSGLARSS